MFNLDLFFLELLSINPKMEAPTLDHAEYNWVRFPHNIPTET